MRLPRSNRLAFAAVLGAFACGGGSTQPLGPPDHLVKSGGDQQRWYFNNPLPLPYSVTVQDASNRPVPGVSVEWSFITGAGSFSVNPSTSNANGVATTVYTLGSSSTNVVNARVTGLPTVMFFTSASAPGTAVGVSVSNFLFTPRDTAVQTGGTVTWTWNSGTTQHNVTYTGGPTPLPNNSPTQDASGPTFSTTFATVGTYTYHCTIHPTTMSGSVTVVH